MVINGLDWFLELCLLFFICVLGFIVIFFGLVYEVVLFDMGVYVSFMVFF